MNETIKNILERRSVRNYKPDQIKDEERDLILKAAMYAPSAMGRQPWHFTVIQNKDLIDRLSSEIKKAIINQNIPMLSERAKEPNFNAFYGAPTIVIISADKSSKFVYADCAVAAENILIAAKSLGVSSCFLASPEIFFGTEEGKKFAREEIGIPEGYEPVFVVTLGYAAGEIPEPATRRENMVRIIK
ncbi:nitroreductase family protein [Thermovorax subterraneus]|nr:nitroreductase family protein [Thermovorax subterraneus]